MLLQFPISPVLAGGTLAGLLIATLMFVLLEKITGFTSFLIQQRLNGSAFADQKFGLHYTILALLSGFIGIIFLRAFHVSVDEVPLKGISRWNPYLTGEKTLISLDSIRWVFIILGFILAVLLLLVRCYTRTEFDFMFGFKTLIGRLVLLKSRDASQGESNLVSPLTGNEASKPQHVLPLDIQLIGSLLFGLLLLLKEAILPTTNNTLIQVEHPLVYPSNNTISITLISSFLASFIQSFGSLMCGSSFVHHLSGITDFRIASFIVIPLSCAVMTLTAYICRLVPIDRASSSY